MAIEKIDESLCNGCGKCIASCANDVFRMDEKTKKPKIVYPEDCSMCMMCEIDCPKHAVYVSPTERYPYPTLYGI
ncbi:MAG: ferredoxin family protein [Dehalococcoidales bacterium]|nr:ferredoxin family protein [Dehalococcoidales bacterium]